MIYKKNKKKTFTRTHPATKAITIFNSAFYLFKIPSTQKSINLTRICHVSL